MITALMLVPLILACGAAVDFARIAASRAQLQAAVDGAAIAGVGAYANEVSAANGNSVALAAFTASTAAITSAVAINSKSAVVGCTGGTTAICGSGGYTTTCSQGTYCVTVTANATQKNALFYPLFSEDITVSGTAQTSATTAGTAAGPTVSYYNLGQAYYGQSNGGINIAHGSGIGSGTPSDGDNSNGYDPAVWFLDGINSALPPASITYNSVRPPSTIICGGSSPTVTAGGTASSVLYLVPGGTYCGGLNLGNAPSQEWDYFTGNAVSVINNNLVVEPDTVVCPEILQNNYTYTGTNVNIQDPCQTNGDNPPAGNYTPIYFGQTSNDGSGSLVLNYNVDITPSTANSGVITFVSNESAIIKSTNSNFTENLGAAVCPGGVTSCTSGAVSANGVSYTGVGTITFQSTYVSTETIQNGQPVAWTEQKTMASQFVTSNGRQTNTQSNTQVAQAGGTYSGSTPNTTVYAPQGRATGVTSTYSPSSYAVGSTDAYTQIDSQCAAQAAAGKLGGTGNIGNTVGVTPATPAVAPISVTNATDLFALTTATPPSKATAQAYNFTDPNYGYSFITSNEEGAVVLTETAYFCGNGNPLTVSNGSATGLTVTATNQIGGITLTQ